MGFLEELLLRVDPSVQISNFTLESPGRGSRWSHLRNANAVWHLLAHCLSSADSRIHQDAVIMDQRHSECGETRASAVRAPFRRSETMLGMPLALWSRSHLFPHLTLFLRPVPQPVCMTASLPPNSCLNALRGGGHGLLGKSNSLSGAAIHGIIPWFSRTSGTFLQGQLLFSKVETCLNSKSDGLEVPWLVRSRGRMWDPELVCVDLWAPYGGFSSFSSHPWGQVFLSPEVVQCPTYPRYSATIS